MTRIVLAGSKGLDKKKGGDSHATTSVIAILSRARSENRCNVVQANYFQVLAGWIHKVADRQHWCIALHAYILLDRLRMLLFACRGLDWRDKLNVAAAQDLPAHEKTGVSHPIIYTTV